MAWCIDLGGPRVSRSPRRRRLRPAGVRGLQPRVDDALLQAVFAQQSRKFFKQPMAMEEKLAMRRDSNHRGYTPPYAQKLDAASGFEGDLKESFYIEHDLNH
ncbi:hypothetical protein EJB05_23678 [Eragrostis curvula]|uniref:Non-haem dioxygenase N-terminal domain-containing protein n=1 Tax=Eragrostis curvula TaxID=38414 RepID=A0A5J9V8Z6_9POAL|nr:hypothetical protein EJB05_23678 [Eragrostis curvula]